MSADIFRLKNMFYISLRIRNYIYIYKTIYLHATPVVYYTTLHSYEVST